MRSVVTSTRDFDVAAGPDLASAACICIAAEDDDLYRAVQTGGVRRSRFQPHPANARNNHDFQEFVLARHGPEPSNMLIQPSDGAVAGFTSVTIPKETGLVGTPSTKPAKDASSKYVLLPALSSAASAPARYVLGPAEMSSASIAEATAYKNRVGQWVVDYTMRSSGARLWDKVAEENFHRMLGVDLNGVVVTAPIIQPTQASFSSFNGKGELAGGFSKAVALALARAMNSKAPGA
jgi:hypothetical protein